MNKKIKVYIVAFLSILLISCSEKSSETFNPNDNESVVGNVDVVSDGHINDIVSELCSDKYLGRVVGTIENENTVDYIENYFASLDIKPLNVEDFRVTTQIGGLSSKRLMDVDNVAAVIKGNSSNSAIFITAHMDHVLSNDGNPLLGAIDNASGISVMLETAHKLSVLTKENPLDVDVVFVAFNAEETGLNGSKEFVNLYKDMYENLYNINIDCVGYNKCEYLAMGNNHEYSDLLYNEMKAIFDEEYIKYNDNLYASRNGMQYGTSDHEIFRRNGYPALVLGDDNLFEVVHTKEDDIGKIDFQELEKLSLALSKFVMKNNDNMFIK